MRVVFGLVLVIGIGLAGFAAYLAKNRFDEYQAKVAEQERQLQSTVPLEAVFIAKKQISYGERITKDHVKIVRWPNNAIPEGAFQEPKELFPDNGDLRVALRVMEKDEAVMAVKVTEPGGTAGFRLDPGMRAVALRVDLTSGVAGFLRPGSRVDVYWTGKIKGREITQRIDSGLEILAIDQITDGERASPTVARTVTVAANANQVAALAQAQSAGRITLALLGSGDLSESLEQVKTDTTSVLGIEEQVVVEEEREQICTTRERKGGQVVEIVIPCIN